MTNLTEIKARLAAATDGPWTTWGQEDIIVSVRAMVKRLGHVTICGMHFAGEIKAQEQQNANADFIAHAPTDIATLIEALEAAEKDKDWLFRFFTVAKTTYPHESRLVECALEIVDEGFDKKASE